VQSTLQETASLRYCQILANSVSYLWHCKVNANYTVPQKRPHFYLLINLVKNEPISIILVYKIVTKFDVRKL